MYRIEFPFTLRTAPCMCVVISALFCCHVSTINQTTYLNNESLATNHDVDPVDHCVLVVRFLFAD
jgi:hypothetical protein